MSSPRVTERSSPGVQLPGRLDPVTVLTHASELKRFLGEAPRLEETGGPEPLIDSDS